MKQFVLLLIVSLLIGCHNPSLIVRSDYAYGGQFAVAKELNDWRTGLDEDGDPCGDLPLVGHHAALLFGVRTEVEYTPFDLEMVVGPAVFVPKGTTNGDFMSVELGSRALIRNFNISPFLEARVGVGYAVGGRWIGEGTRHLYSVTGTVGLSARVGDHFKLEVGYRFHHLSNGSVIFGSSLPNSGYNSDMVVFGLSCDF